MVFFSTLDRPIIEKIYSLGTAFSKLQLIWTNKHSSYWLIMLCIATAMENFVSLLLFENVVLSHSHSHFPFESDKTVHNACFFLLKKVTATQLGELAETLKERHLLRAQRKLCNVEVGPLVHQYRCQHHRPNCGRTEKRCSVLSSSCLLV